MKSQSFETYATTQIAIYNAMLGFIPKIKEVAQKFDGKVINARFTTALEAASPMTQTHGRTEPVFRCSFAERYDGAKDLSVELFYLDGECYYNQRYMNEFYNLEDYNNRIYGGPLDAAEFSRRLEKAAEVIRQNIDDLRDQMAGFGEALAKYNSIYEELKKLEPYRSAMKHCTEREFEFARRLADVYVGL